jgi:hypothetical protein
MKYTDDEILNLKQLYTCICCDVECYKEDLKGSQMKQHYKQHLLSKKHIKFSAKHQNIIDNNNPKVTEICQSNKLEEILEIPNQSPMNPLTPSTIQTDISSYHNHLYNRNASPLNTPPLNTPPLNTPPLNTPPLNTPRSNMSPLNTPRTNTPRPDMSPMQLHPHQTQYGYPRFDSNVQNRSPYSKQYSSNRYQSPSPSTNSSTYSPNNSRNIKYMLDNLYTQLHKMQSDIEFLHGMINSDEQLSTEIDYINASKEILPNYN